MDPKPYQQTADIAQKFGVIKAAPTDGAYVTDYAKKALDGIKEDTSGVNYKPEDVKITAGGQ